ncbi:MAG: hypothetical protein ACI9TY_000958 [Alphaproteobacteria bacterium]|jgi:hypothetical protein
METPKRLLLNIRGMNIYSLDADCVYVVKGDKKFIVNTDEIVVPPYLALLEESRYKTQIRFVLHTKKRPVDSDYNGKSLPHDETKKDGEKITRLLQDIKDHKNMDNFAFEIRQLSENFKATAKPMDLLTGFSTADVPVSYYTSRNLSPCYIDSCVSEVLYAMHVLQVHRQMKMMGDGLVKLLPEHIEGYTIKIYRMFTPPQMEEYLTDASLQYMRQKNLKFASYIEEKGFLYLLSPKPHLFYEYFGGIADTESYMSSEWERIADTLFKNK